MCDELTEGTVGVAHEILLQFLEVLGVNVCHNEFDGNIDDGEFCPRLHPEHILVRRLGKLVEVGGVFPDGCIDFSVLCRVLFVTVPLLSVERAVLLRARERQTWWPPHAVVRTYGGANLCHFTFEVVNIFRVWMPGEDVEWF